jgi:2OG-Fe dioxygenase
MDRFTMRESGECYVFDDDRIWHGLTPVTIMEGNQYAYRDTLAFDMLPRALGSREVIREAPARGWRSSASNRLSGTSILSSWHPNLDAESLSSKRMQAFARYCNFACFPSAFLIGMSRQASFERMRKSISGCFPFFFVPSAFLRN